MRRVGKTRQKQGTAADSDPRVLGHSQGVAKARNEGMIAKFKEEAFLKANFV